jgi:hypothetical protein
MSGLLSNQGHDGLLAIHPSRGGRASPGNHVMDALIIVGQISGKDWFMMGYPVAQVPDGLKIGISLRPALRNGLRERRPREERPEMRVPKSAILAGCEDVLPRQISAQR